MSVKSKLSSSKFTERRPSILSRAGREPSPQSRLVVAHSGVATLEQMDQLREAFATLSDVLIEELDSLRSDSARRWELAEAHLNRQAQSIKALRADMVLLRGEIQSGLSARDAHQTETDERVEGVRAAAAQLANELASAGSAQQLLQLELVQQKIAADRAAKVLEDRLERSQHSFDALTEQMAEQREDSESALAALDKDVGVTRELTEETTAAVGSALDVHKDKLLQCATAIEKQWSQGKEVTTRLDSLAATQALIQQQVQDRLDASSKQSQRWRASLEDSLKAGTADMHALKLASARSTNEPLPEPHLREIRRLLDDRDEATRRQLETLGRAIQSLADSVHVPSPLVIGGVIRG